MSKRTSQVNRFAFQNPKRFSSWTLKESCRQLKTLQLCFWDIFEFSGRNWRKFKWKQSNTKYKLKFRVFSKSPNVQKLIFQNMLRIGQNFEHKSCRYCFNLQVCFWPKLKCSSKFEWKVKIYRLQRRLLCPLSLPRGSYWPTSQPPWPSSARKFAPVRSLLINLRRRFLIQRTKTADLFIPVRTGRWIRAVHFESDGQRRPEHFGRSDLADLISAIRRWSYGSETSRWF